MIEELYNLKYEDRLVAFIDLLGFSEIVESLDAADAGIARIASLLDELQAESLMVRLRQERDRQVVMFSDTIVVSERIPDAPADVAIFCNDIGRLWLRLADRRVLGRGAITLGRLIHRGHVIYGQALIDAYRLETALASYPRIVLSRRFLKEYGACPFVSEYVRLDADGVEHLHVFSSSRAIALAWFRTSVYRSWIEKQLWRELPLRVHQKYAWLASYFNESLRAHATMVPDWPEPVVEPIDLVEICLAGTGCKHLGIDGGQFKLRPQDAS